MEEEQRPRAVPWVKDRAPFAIGRPRLLRLLNKGSLCLVGAILTSSMADLRSEGFGDPWPFCCMGFQREMLMPSHGTLADEEIAAVFTYIRAEWGSGADAISSQTVERVRGATQSRTKP